MKKTLCITLAAVCLLLFSGCGLFRAKPDTPSVEASSELPEPSQSQSDNSSDPSSQAPSSVPSTPEPVKVFPVHLIGKTVRELHLAYGKNHGQTGFKGSTILDFESLETGFVLEKYVGGSLSGKEKIICLIGYGENPVYEQLTGNLTLLQLKLLLGDRVSLGEPEGYYNEIDECYVYNLTFCLDGFEFTYVWDATPKNTKSQQVIVYAEDYVFSEPESEAESRPVSAYGDCSQEATVLISKTEKALPQEVGEGLTLEFYYEDDTVISCYINGDPYTFMGLEIFKSTGLVQVHNYSGRICREFYV